MERAETTVPPVMSMARLTAMFRAPYQPGPAGGSLNRSSTLNSFSPSCSAGTSTNRAVSGAGPSSSVDAVAVLVPGCAATVSSSAVVSARPSAVHSAPAVPHLRSAMSTMPMFPVPSGVTVISHRSLRPSTRLAPVTLPPLTSNALSRTSPSLFAMSSLKLRRKVNAVTPSWSSGRPSKLAVSAAASSTCAALSGSSVPVHSRCTSSLWSGSPFGFVQLFSPTPAW